MRVLLVSGRTPVPADLRHVLERGSTSLEAIGAADLRTYVSREGLGVDRVVFWAGHDDQDIRTLAWNYATAAGAERRDTVFLVAAQPTEPVDGMTGDEVFVWPRDEDRLKLLFMTGA